MPNRRTFLKSSLGFCAITPVSKSTEGSASQPIIPRLDAAAARTILKMDNFRSPVKIDKIELFRSGNLHFVRSISTDGAVGIGVTNSRAHYLYPILEQRVIPYFIGKDARHLEQLIDGVYVYQSNYKLSGLALWNCVAWVEFSLLDMLGKIANKHVGELFGGGIRKKIPIYRASGNRHTTPEEEAEILKRIVEETGVKAVKFKVGGRMSNNKDSIPGRSEKLIPLARKVLGDEVTIHADSNGSYDCQKGIEIGKLMEEQNFHFYEEPCPFDHLWDTKCVADALEIPIAGGEQESSMRRFRWMIANQAVQIVQPDLHYFGGYIRATKVARMAAEAGMPITVHMSGGGTGFVEMLNFNSFTPNIGQYHEYKGDIETVGQWYDPPLELKDGQINVPVGPGMGINTEPEFLKDAKRVVPT